MMELEVGGRPFVIGRGKDCDLAVDQPAVSRQHAVLRRDGSDLWIEDLGSSNGTFVNGSRTSRSILGPGDRFSIGASNFSVTPRGIRADSDEGLQLASRSGPAIAALLTGIGAIIVFMVAGPGLRAGPAEDRISDPASAGGAMQPGALPESTDNRPVETDTAVPQATRRALATQVAEAPARAASVGVQPLRPVDGATAGRVDFAWQSVRPLAPGEVFDVRVCKGEACQPAAGRTNTTASDWAWCPDAGVGTYRWQVLLIEQRSKKLVGVGGPIAEFEWTGGCEKGEEKAKSAPSGVPTVHVEPPTAERGGGKGAVTPELP